MIKASGSYSSYDYEYGQCNSSDKWILKQTHRYRKDDCKTYLFNSEDECREKINEIELMFDHKSQWD